MQKKFIDKLFFNIFKILTIYFKYRYIIIIQIYNLKI